MSLLLSLDYYRPTPPPALSGRDLHDFLLAFEALGIAEETSGMLAEAAFGRPVDANHRPATWIHWQHDNVGLRKTVAWDLQNRYDSLSAMAVGLARFREPTYRARLSLGNVGGPLRRIVSSRADVRLFSWALDIGPVEATDRRGDGVYYVGWMGLRLLGEGSVASGALQALRRQLERNAAVREAMALCRRRWPVPAVEPSRRTARLRSWLGELWPYEDPGAPMDWRWTLNQAAAPAPFEESSPMPSFARPR